MALEFLTKFPPATTQIVGTKTYHRNLLDEAICFKVVEAPKIGGKHDENTRNPVIQRYVGRYVCLTGEAVKQARS